MPAKDQIPGTEVMHCRVGLKEMADIAMWMDSTFGIKYHTRSGLVREIVKQFHELLVSAGQLKYACDSNEDAYRILAYYGVNIKPQFKNVLAQKYSEDARMTAASVTNFLEFGRKKEEALKVLERLQREPAVTDEPNLDDALTCQQSLEEYEAGKDAELREFAEMIRKVAQRKGGETE